MNRNISKLTYLLLILININCSEDKEVIAYSLEINISPPNGGVVSPNSGKHASGEVITLIANPSSDYKFDYWSDDASGNNKSIELIMDSNKIITANFKIKDSDSDGISDNLDQCPDTPDGEAVDSNGCSNSQIDSDSDGISDNLDHCPDTPDGEAVDSNGCSNSQIDSDSDGISDNLDHCPDTPDGEAVDSNGCSLYNLGNILWSSNMSFNMKTYDDVDLIEIGNYYFVLDEDADLFKVDKSNGNVIWEKANLTGINHDSEVFYKTHLLTTNDDLVIITSSTSKNNILKISSNDGSILNSANLNFIVNDVYKLESGNFLNLNYNTGNIVNELGVTIETFNFANFDSGNYVVNDIGTNFAFMETSNSYFILDYNINSSYTNSPRSGYFNINKSDFALNDSHVYLNSESSRNLFFIKSSISIQNNIGVIHQENSQNYEFSIYADGKSEVYSKNINKLFSKNIGLINNNFILLGQIDPSIYEYFPSAYNDKTFLLEISKNGEVIEKKIYDVNFGFRFYKNNFIIDTEGNIVCATDEGKLVKLEY